MSRPVVELQAVSKQYSVGDQWVQALCEVSYSFYAGSFCAIQGQSGSGKSTLLHLLGCLDRPTSGRYLLNGQDVSQMDDHQLSAVRLSQIGFIFQSFHLIPQLTVRQNIQLPLTYLGWSSEQAEARAQELGALVDLASRMDHRPLQLSGGQQQRVAIARALANDPELILADEPTGNLDERTGAEVMDLLLHACSEEGASLILVTHNLVFAQATDRQTFLSGGRLNEV